MSIKNKGYTVQCCKCLCILGVSSKNFQHEEIYCMKHAKEETNLPRTRKLRICRRGDWKNPFGTTEVVDIASPTKQSTSQVKG